jgi:seryl-tRNA synthetase
MLDLDFIREHPERVAEAARQKGVEVNVEKILDLDRRRRRLIAEVDERRRERNRLSRLMKAGPKPDLVKKAKKVKERLRKDERRLALVEAELEAALAWVPNLPADEVPVAADASGNRVVKEWGKIPHFAFPAADHLEIGRRLGLLDLERGAKVSGFRGYFLKNEAVLMELGLMLYSLGKLVQKGFTPLLPPVLVKEFALFGTGWLPWGEDEKYHLEETDLFLAATAEVPVTAYRAGEILPASDLPKLYAAFSPCFRREAGSHGKDVKGLYRVHQFNKVEQVVLCRHDLEESRRWHEKLLANAEEILQELKLPYRVVLMSTGDMGEPQVKKYDIETWMPGRGGYGETHSDSIMADFQARRLNIRYREKGETKFVHTLNNTAVASPRLLIAIWENYQRQDGSLVVPDVLRPYVGKEVIKPKDGVGAH